MTRAKNIEQPLFASHEIGLLSSEVLDLCEITRTLVDTAQVMPLARTEAERLFSGIPHRNYLMPDQLRNDIGRASFSRLAMVNEENQACPNGLRIIARDLDIPSRKLTFIPLLDEPEFVAVEDTHHAVMTVHGREVEPVVKRHDVAMWLASQATGSAVDAQFLAHDHGDNLLEVAVGMLQDDASRIMVSQRAITPLATGGNLMTQSAAQFMGRGESHFPVTRHYSASIGHLYKGDHLFAELDWLQENLVVSFCPERGVIIPCSETDDDTSVRVDLQTPPGHTSLEYFEMFTAARAVDIETFIVDLFKNTLAKVTDSSTLTA